MVHLDALDLADDLVGRRIDQHDAVAGGVGLDDPDGGGLQGEGGGQASTASEQEKVWSS